MNNDRLTYSITSLASNPINNKFREAKTDFNLLIHQQKTKEDNFILKNLAHITLKGMFYLKNDELEEELKKQLNNITFEPISIYAEVLDIFESPKHGNVLVIKVNKTSELKKLHKDIVNIINQFSTNEIVHHELDDFTPHLSILYNLPENRIEEAKQYAISKLLPITYSLNSFLFMKGVAGAKNERELVKEYLAS